MPEVILHDRQALHHAAAFALRPELTADMRARHSSPSLRIGLRASGTGHSGNAQTGFLPDLVSWTCSRSGPERCS